MKLEKATPGDIILSLILPGWGLLIGLIALVKQERRRGLTMIALSLVLLAALFAWQFSPAGPAVEPQAAANGGGVAKVSG